MGTKAFDYVLTQLDPQDVLLNKQDIIQWYARYNIVSLKNIHKQNINTIFFPTDL